MKLTDEEIITILKAFNPKEVLDKYMGGIISLTAKQSNRLIKMKNGERENFMTDKEREGLEKIAHDEDEIKLEGTNEKVY